MTRRHEILLEVTKAIAEAEDSRSNNADYSLYDYIDPEALIRLVESDNTDWRLVFKIRNHTVKISGNGQINVDDTVRREFEFSSPPSK